MFSYSRKKVCLRAGLMHGLVYLQVKKNAKKSIDLSTEEYGTRTVSWTSLIKWVNKMNCDILSITYLWEGARKIVELQTVKLFVGRVLFTKMAPWNLNFHKCHEVETWTNNSFIYLFKFYLFILLFLFNSLFILSQIKYTMAYTGMY